MDIISGVNAFEHQNDIVELSIPLYGMHAKIKRTRSNGVYGDEDRYVRHLSIFIIFRITMNAEVRIVIKDSPKMPIVLDDLLSIPLLLSPRFPQYVALPLNRRVSQQGEGVIQV
jgi:hypothetical protein